MTHQVQIRAAFDSLLPDEIIVDNFAAGGGASEGIEKALNRPVDIAINHDAEAIAMHKANHPKTKHYIEDIWQVDPREACAGRPVGLAWFSPDCTHFSKAKGATPVKKEIRGLAWVMLRWAKAVKPRVMILENVEEFQTWGPLIETADGLRPDPSKKGETFRQWLGKLKAQGYSVEFTSLVAADYGAATIRKRLFLIARRDGQTIEWPERTHGKGTENEWIPAASVIDWSLPCPSVFLTHEEAVALRRATGINCRRPLALATKRRIALGVQRYVIDAQQPFIVRHGHYSTITGAGLHPGCGAGTFRGQSLEDPLATICATNDKHLVVPILNKHYGGMVGHEVTKPMGSITGRDSHGLSQAILEERPTGRSEDGHRVRAFLTKFYGGGKNGKSGIAQDLRDPLHTIRGNDCFGLVTVHGRQYEIVDIGMRMLEPHELYAAQGFGPDYIRDVEHNGRKLTKKAVLRMVGNSVAPDVAEALVGTTMHRAA